MLIHIIKTESDLKEMLIPQEDYFVEHTLSSLYEYLKDITTDSEHLTKIVLKQKLNRGLTCLVFVKQPEGDHKVYLIPEPKKVLKQ